MKETNKIYQDYKFLWKNKIFLFFLILFVILNISDGILTYYGMEYRGLRESNELFGSCINDGNNYVPVLVAKTSFFIVIALLSFMVFKYYSRWFGYFLIIFANLIQLEAVVLWLNLLL